MKKSTMLLLTTILLLALSSSLVSCKNDELQVANEVVDSTMNTQSTDDSDNHDTSYYLNNNDSVLFQEAVFKFAKAYFSADQEEIKKYLAKEVEPEVWDKDIFDDLSRLVLKWNPEELAMDKTMNVQYEFMVEGEDTSQYLGMVLEFHDEEWIVMEYYLEQ